MWGMWVNCIYGGKGVGMINLLLFLIVGVFIAGQMVGRSPEYLGKKVGARGMKLAMIALLVHPIMILDAYWRVRGDRLGPQGGGQSWSARIFRDHVQYSSASANNGSAFDGLGVTYGLNNNPNPAPEAVPWDVGTGLVILFSRYLPIVAPIALAAFLGAKKPILFSSGTM